MIRRENLAKSYPIVKLGNLVEFLDHLRVPVTEKDRIPGDYPYYGANGQLGTINKYLFDEPLVLLAEDGGHFGEPFKSIAYKVTGKHWVNNHAHVLRPNESIDIDFLFRHLQFYDVTPFIAGTTRAKLNKAQASKIPLILPPIKIQKRIIAILDKADALRQKRKQAIALLDEFLRSTFLEMFGDPSKNTNNWEVGSFREITIRTQYGTSKKGNNSEIGLPYLRMNNITYDGKIDLTSMQWIELDKKEYGKYTVKKGDLLFNRTNSPELVGKAAV